MKERPPFSVLLVAGIISLTYGGAMIAEMLLGPMYGKYSFYFSALIPFGLMFGLLKGYEIARAWLMALSAIACLAGVIGLIIGVGRLIFPAPLEGTKDLNILEVIAGLVIVGLTFWGSWTAKTRKWCSPSQGAISTRSAVTISTLFLVVGTLLWLPKTIIKRWENAPFPVNCKVKLQTTTKEAAVASVFKYHGIKATTGANSPQISVVFNQVDKLRRTATLEGVAYGPFQVAFSALGYKQAECTISNGSPREITLTLKPEKESLRAERKADH